jgi:hypothetical protein
MILGFELGLTRDGINKYKTYSLPLVVSYINNKKIFHSLRKSVELIQFSIKFPNYTLQELVP